MKCRHCNSTNTIRRGNKNRKYRQVTQHECKDCGKYTLSFPNHSISARVLLLDIETSPMEYYTWDKEPRYLSPDMRIKDWGILCWAAKWLFEPEIMGEVVTPKEAKSRTQESILGGIWNLMNEANIIVTQNGIKFDIKRLNTKFIKSGYAPPSKYQNIDTLRVAQEKFDPTYKSLEELGREFLELEDGKIKMRMGDWKQCVTGDQEALNKMLTYCKNDVAPLLEDVYLVMRPWMTGHPNLGVYHETDEDVCPNCESTNLKWSEEYATPQGLWSGFRCMACGATGRGTTNDYNVKKVHIKSS